MGLVAARMSGLFVCRAIFSSMPGGTFPSAFNLPKYRHNYLCNRNYPESSCSFQIRKLQPSHLASLYQQGILGMRYNGQFLRKADEFLKLRRSSLFHSHVFRQVLFMKTLIFLLCCVTVASAQGQSLGNNETNSTSQTIVGYQLGGQAANQNVWQKIIQITDNQGNVTYQTNNAYTELATGLNHLVNGQWVASKEEIDISAGGSGASATNGQHQAYFPGDIYSGQIELVTPDGKQLYSRPVGLSYFDGTNSVLIAELTNSTGEVLPSDNQVLYTNAFTDFGADIRYTYTKAGFEQDIILREQPPTPASFGLNPDTTRLQVLTEFFNPPQPTVNATTVSTDAGDLENDNLDFGVMQMMPGKAFLLETTTPSVGVNKQWLLLDGRQMLVEEVPVVSIADELANLPLPQTTSSQPDTPLNVVSTKRLLPEQRLATIPNKHPMQMAQVTPSSHGLVLDYVMMTSQTNWTFQGDTTYYISGTVNLYQTNTFEGGAVLKYTNNASVNLESGNVLNWQAAAYRPVIFTAKDDNSVGDAISGSTGSPTNYYANPALNFNGNSSASYFRIAWASQAVSVAGSATISLYHGQLVNCLNGITFSYGTMNVRNLLFANVQTNFNNLGANSLSVQNSTFSGSACVIQGPDYSSPIFTNCILANVTNLANGSVPSFSGTSNGFYNCHEFGTGPITNSYPFQSVGGGNYYLTNGCAFFNAGTTNIDLTLLTNLQQKTTYPPLFLTNQTISINTTLNPQAQRDTDIPDLGYHYDPLDYCWNNLNLTNATMTLTNGVAIGVYGYFGLTLQNGATLLSQGTPLTPNQLVNYHSVQEQTNLLGATNTSCAYLVPYATNSVIRLRFTDVSTVAMPHDTIYLVEGTGLNSFNLMDCQVSAMLIYIFDPLIVSPGYVGITNNIFWRCHLDFGNLVNTYPLNFYNNLCLGGETDFYGGSSWNVKNNLFDTVTTAAWTGVVNDYNGYYNSTELPGAGGDDQIITKDDYQKGPLGNYYYPTNGYYNLSWLLNSGNTTASALGLYHYTMTTNQMVEGTNIVSIGYHYVATTNGIPLDSNGDGIPDYLEDANGNGTVDSGEIGWNIYGDLGLKVLITRPRNGSILP
jgi:hypothetical protein